MFYFSYYFVYLKKLNEICHFNVFTSNIKKENLLYAFCEFYPYKYTIFYGAFLK